ncbi:MAG: bifunctional methionine sulfoxide reductase B/A protein [Gammaproteobacteria bacterium]
MSAYLDKLASITPIAQQIICNKATEPPGSGEYNQIATQGTYLCRRCGWALFRASSQFSAGCGWPSFDEDLLQRVHHSPDPDGMRVEIVCGRCTAHLGHVFTGENFTAKSVRYCVNSLALDFVVDSTVLDTAEAIVAGGCFWGIEHALKQIPGVVKAESGYTGGNKTFPTYSEVCGGDTGHYEAVRVVYDVAKTDYTTVLSHFFASHNPYQADGQGPDRGSQYRSAVFYYDAMQNKQATEFLKSLAKDGSVATVLHPVTTFWPAEAYHQDYYDKHPNAYRCAVIK